MCDEGMCYGGGGFVLGSLSPPGVPPLSPLPEIVHEDLKMGSDGESDQASATSSDEVQSPVRVCGVTAQPSPTKISTEVLNSLSGQWWAGKGLDMEICS